MKFDLADLRIFLAAVDGGSLTAAAARNNIVVAAVSARIRRLETAFNLELFVRTGRGIKPTAPGEMLAQHARRVLEEARKTELELEEFAYGRSGGVRLLSNTNMLFEHMPKAIGTFLAANPEISVTVSDKPSLEVVNMLRNGDADIGVVAVSADMTGLEQFEFVADRLVLVAAADRLVEEPIPFARVLDLPIIGVTADSALSQFLSRQAHELGRRATIRMRTEGFESLCTMVETNAGVGIIPESAARRYGKFMNIRSIVIDESWSSRKLYLCVRNRQQLPRYAQRLLAHLLNYADALAEPGQDSGKG
jgi:DNA-binding transcriptional LysR family regulator